MPLYPYDPFEEVLSERDEEFTDMNSNGVWDNNEPLVDNNNNGLHDQYRPATTPDNYHIMAFPKRISSFQPYSIFIIEGSAS